MPRTTASLDRYQRRCGVAVLGASVLLLSSLGARLVYINTSLRDRLLGIADRQQQGESVIPARRGMILDSRGRIAASSEQRPDVFVDPSRVRDIDALARDLSPRLNLPASRIAERIRQRPTTHFTVIEASVDSITADAVAEMKHPAVGLSQRAARTYPLGESLAHVLGWVGRDGGGLEGVEMAFDRHLRGKDGRRTTIRDARRRALRRREDEVIPPTDGGHVVLTIDAEIQRMTEDALADAVEHVEAESGVAIVMSPRTGEVLAMACYPTFDPNDSGAYDGERRRNRALTDPVEPGSAFKPVIASGALEGSYISPTQLIDCHMGTRSTFGRTVTDVHAYGMLDVKGIITHSSNIGMSIISEKMGNAALHATIRRFGFGRRTGIECPGDAPGLVYPLRAWTKMSAASIGMGYEILVTPLQLINAFAAIVNDGTMLKPRVVKRLLAADGEVVGDFERPEVVGRVTSSSVAHYMADELLVSVVENGSGKGAKLDHYQVLGKTGTAKLKYRDRKEYEPGAYQATFVGAAPAKRAEIVALVMIRRPNPKVAYYGSAVAAPVVGTILGQALPYLGVPPDEAQLAHAGP